jgi:hypothetical protein
MPSRWLHRIGVYCGLVEAPEDRPDPVERDREWAARSNRRIVVTALGQSLCEGLVFGMVYAQFSSGRHAGLAIRPGAVFAGVMFVTFVVSDVLHRVRARRRLSGAVPGR